MKKARPADLTENAVPALVLVAGERRLRELFPVPFSRVDPLAEPEPSKGALIELDSGEHVVVMYGKFTKRVTISFAESADVPTTLAALLREAPVRRHEVAWVADDAAKSMTYIGERDFAPSRAVDRVADRKR
jgi:hypothetical protein